MNSLSALESIFVAALDKHSAADRAAYLDEACAHDPELRRHVDRLLDAQARAGSFLQQPGAGLAGTIDEPPRERPGTIIGPYKLLQQIGEGGMGVVYMAEQQEPVRRKVALKIIKPGMDSAQVIARFEAERQALAMMDHQNIAKVFDAGTTDSGRPYFVMELVHGVPITQFCDDNKLTPRERLALFVPVCQAIQHAHQKGIIHRDIKPSNVLVTLYDDKPVPKVIDFGVAKAIEQRLTEKSLFTQFGALVGTFEYMSPEQAEMNAFGVDTRSDIYSLGVLLYELLTGTTPLERSRLREAALDEMVRLIKEEEPPRPSVRLSNSGTLAKIAAARKTEPAKLSKLVRGEIDWIVMRCLEKDRTRRYETANGLARDVEHYLKDEPVEACPPSAGYKVRKFARKHKKLLATAAAFAALLLLGATVSSWQAVRATWAEQDAAQQRDTAVANEQRAWQNEKAAGQQRDNALAAREELRRTLYAAEMNLVQAAWDASHVARALDLLDRQTPKAGQTDLRGFEWLYWDRQCHGDLHSVQLPTKGYFQATAFNPDGTRVATVIRSQEQGEDVERVQLWEVATGKEIHAWTPPRMASRIGGLAQVRLVFSGDGTRLAMVRHSIASLKGERPPKSKRELRVWDTASGKELATVPVGSGGMATALSPDGKRIAMHANGTVVILDSLTGKQLLSAEGINGGLACLAFSPDGTRLAAGGGTGPKGKLLVLDASTGKQVLEINAGNLDNVTFSPDGKRLASVGFVSTGTGMKGEVRIWDAATGAALLTIPHPSGQLPEVRFSADGKRLAGWSQQGTEATVLLWDAATGELRRTIKGHNDPVASVAFSADDTRLHTLEIRGTVKVWDTAAATFLPSDPRKPLTVVPNAEGTRYAEFPRYVKPGQTDVTLRDQTRREPFVFREHTGSVVALVFSPDDKHIASLDDAGEVIVWAVATGQIQLRRKCSGPSGLQEQHAARQATNLIFSADGRRLAVRHPGALVRVWDVHTGKELLAPDGQQILLAFCPKGNLVITRPWISRVGETTVWDLATGQERFRLGKTAGKILFSPDGTRIAAATGPVGKPVAGMLLGSDRGPGPDVVQPKEVRVWDAATGAEQFTLRGHLGSIRGVAFSPDATRFVSASSGIDQTAQVKVWDLPTGKELFTLHIQSAFIQSVAFSPDGKRVAAVATSGVAKPGVKLWDATTGHEVLSLDIGPSIGGELNAAEVRFSREGKRLFLFSEYWPGHGLLTVWDGQRPAEPR